MFSLAEVLSLKEISSFIATQPSTSSTYTPTTNSFKTTTATSFSKVLPQVTNMHPSIALPAVQKYG